MTGLAVDTRLVFTRLAADTSHVFTRKCEPLIVVNSSLSASASGHFGRQGHHALHALLNVLKYSRAHRAYSPIYKNTGGEL